MVLVPRTNSRDDRAVAAAGLDRPPPVDDGDDGAAGAPELTGRKSGSVAA